MDAPDQPREAPVLDPSVQAAVLAAQTITLDEVGVLLEQATMRDQRNSGPADVTAWWIDLNLARARVTYPKAMAALSYFYAIEYPSLEREKRHRVEAADIIRLVARSDAELTANFVYQPDPGDSPSETISRAADQRAALVEGVVAPVAIGQAQRNPDYVRALASWAAQATGMPQDARPGTPAFIQQALGDLRHPARSIYCPSCHAQPGQACTNLRGKLDRGRRLHPSRIDTWAVDRAGCQECRARIGEPCKETNGMVYGRVHAPRLKDAGAGAQEREAA